MSQAKEYNPNSFLRILQKASGHKDPQATHSLFSTEVTGSQGPVLVRQKLLSGFLPVRGKMGTQDPKLSTLFLMPWNVSDL